MAAVPINTTAGGGAAMGRCGVDQFCISKGGVSPLSTPEAQGRCIGNWCMAGDADFAQYNIGGTYTINWDAQLSAEIYWAVEAFLSQEAGVAARLGLPSVQDLRNVYLNPDGSLKDPNGRQNPFRQGGNWNFWTTINLGCDRCGSIPSLHFKSGFVHLDTANPFWGYGIGGAIHGVGDGFLGNTFLATGIRR